MSTLRFWGLGLLPPLLVGAALRCIGIRAQILTDDELHTVAALLARPVGEILRSISYEGADYCVPLTALFRLLIDQGLVLGEMSFRVPSLAAGLIALIAIPLLLAPRVGERAAALCAWLLAISPMLVLYSRILRPYMLATLFAFCAVMSFDAWLRSRTPRAAAAYVVLAALSVYFHLGTGPLVLAPFGYFALRALHRGEPMRELRSGALLFAATLLAIALPLLPMLDSLLELMQIRRDGQLPPLTAWLEVVQIEVGTRSALVAVMLSLLAAAGAWLLRQRDTDLFGLVATIATLHVLGLIVLAPDRMQEASVLGRYLLVLLPFGLLLAVLPLAKFVSLARSPTASATRTAGVVGLGAMLFATGPLASADYHSSAFAHTPSFLRITHPPDRIPSEHVPGFYHQLALENDSAAIVEHPWLSQASHALAAYQNLHHRPVLVSSLVEGYHDARLDFQNVLQPTEEDFLESPARYLIVHLDLHAEARRVITGDPHHALWLKARTQVWEPLRLSGRNTAARLSQKWGAPVHADATIQVWDLKLIRSQKGLSH